MVIDAHAGSLSFQTLPDLGHSQYSCKWCSLFTMGSSWKVLPVLKTVVNYHYYLVPIISMGLNRQPVLTFTVLYALSKGGLIKMAWRGWFLLRLFSQHLLAQTITSPTPQQVVLCVTYLLMVIAIEDTVPTSSVFPTYVANGLSG